MINSCSIYYGVDWSFLMFDLAIAIITLITALINLIGIIISKRK